MAADPSDDDTLLLEALKRADALRALRNGPMTRANLMDVLGVSRTTIHRTVRSLEEQDLIIQKGSTFELSAFGRTVADEVSTYRRRLSAAQHVKSFLETISDAPFDLDVGLLAEATVTKVEPTNPYAPVGRFMELLKQSETLRGFDTTTVAPIYVEEIREEILGGMETDIVYLPTVIEDMLDAYPDDLTAAAESGRLSLWKHDELPFGLAIFDERIGLGAYDDETGMLRVFVDTDAPEARKWAVDLYRQYREEAGSTDLSSVSR
ncbi:helix-turn-helix transcriptional regulator [Haloprofundus salilacus]|uniref:helix-turn-helix transcriptional regulator n=1 Tax=Haloprofundus salilacus TaxID=2876190 RepID=UPI001CCF5B3A|nr:helix-turn-helix domain-containing protein [Haloprofundus salilacus]